MVSANNTSPVVPGFESTLSECTEDLTGQTLVYYSFGDLSGPYAFITQPLIAGLEDATAFLNDNGGVCGATVVQEYRDTGGAQEQSQAFWDEFSAKEDAHMIYLYASADGELLLEQAVNSGIVLLNAAASEKALFGESGESSWQFSTIPLYVDQMGLFCDYLAANWETISAERGIEGDPTIGHLSWEGAFGRSSDTEPVRAYCESVGVGYAGAEYFLPGTPDISTQLQTLVDAGANVIYSTSLASGPAQVAGTVATLQLPVLVSGVNWALDTSVIALGGEASNGLTGNLPYLWWDETEEPSIQQITAIWAEKRLAADPEGAVRLRNIAYVGAFGTLDIWAEAHIRAINTVGFENLTGEAIYTEMQNMQFEAFGGFQQVDYTEGRRSGANSRIGQIQFIEADAGIVPAILPLTEWMPVPSLSAAMAGE
jgi:branched-chain amino acid transport system substrate-binding protein